MHGMRTWDDHGCGCAVAGGLNAAHIQRIRYGSLLGLANFPTEKALDLDYIFQEQSEISKQFARIFCRK